MTESDKHVENTQFPDDLRVLAIDDNLVCLRWLEALLKKCRYNVTATTNSLEALEMLRQNKDNFDIVITDVRRFDDMDGFSLLDIISLEMDLPVIMISADDDTSTVMKGIRHGARDYLLKPVRMEVIKNIWQHVVRKSLSDPNKSCITKGVTDQNPACLKRHRDSSKEKQDETNTQSDGDSGAQKKKRVTWTPELHNKFVDAIEQLGENAVPKQILQIMNEPGINRENVASHLQKFRKMLKKSCKMSEESNKDIYPNNKGGHISNTPILFSGSRSGVHGNSNAEMTQLGNGILKSDPFGSSHMDLKRLFQLPNQQNPLLQQYPQTLQLVDKTQPRMHIPVHGNALQTPLWVENHLPVPEFNGLKFPTFSSEPMVHNGLMEVSSCFPSFNTGSEPGPSSKPLVVHRPNSYPSATTFFDLPYPMPGDASNVTTSTATTPNPQQNPVVMPVQNFFMGQHEGRSYVDLNGRSQINGFSFGIQSPIIQDSNGNDQINSLHPSQENLQTFGSFHHIRRSDSEDDLSVMVKQFGDDGAPTL